MAERAHALRRRDLVTGVRVLGAVVERFSDRLELQLPGRALGSVAVGEASDELAELVAGGSSTAPDLRKLFEVGEVVPCVVLPPTAQQTAGRPAVPLTLRLSAVQGPFLGELESCPAGVPVWASVRSRESHGAVMRTGGKAGGFLGAEGAQLKRWRAHLCVTAKPTRGGAPLQLVRFGGDATAAPLPHRALPRLEGFVAGMLVGATVEAALPNGLRVRVGQYFEGTIEEESLGRTVRDWQRAPELRRGAKIVARLLWAQPELKRLGLSLAPHLVACARYEPPAAAGTRRAASVDAVIAGGALAHHAPGRRRRGRRRRRRRRRGGGRLPADGSSGGAAARADGGRCAAEAQGGGAAGGGGDRRAVARRPGRVSARRAAKAGADDEIYSYDAVTVGASLRGTILRLDDDGAKLRLGRDVSGRVPVLHLSDKPLARPQQRLKKGQPLDCLVLQCDPAKKLVRLSAKTELLGSPLPRIASYADATAGVESHGVVIAVREEPSPSHSSVASSAVCVARRFAQRSALCGRRRRARATARGRWSAAASSAATHPSGASCSPSSPLTRRRRCRPPPSPPPSPPAPSPRRRRAEPPRRHHRRRRRDGRRRHRRRPLGLSRRFVVRMAAVSTPHRQRGGGASSGVTPPPAASARPSPRCSC